MSKRIEVYFILYLGLLMAFFGIDSEVADYIENQERILAQVAKSKLKNLIEIQSQHLNKVKDNFNLSFDLQGDFDKGSFNAKLFFKHDKNESDTFSVALEKEIVGGFYSALVKRSQFGSQNETYTVQIAYDVEPYFSDSSRAELLLEFGKKGLVDEIINNIYSEGSYVQDTLTVGLTIKPDAVRDATFMIKPLQDPLNSLRGLNGKIELFVAGVESSDDYTLQVESDREEYRTPKIKKGNSGAEIILGSLRRNGEVRVIGRRLKGGDISRSTIKVKTFKPRFKSKNRHRNEIYFNSPFTFDGTLANFDSFDDLRRYSLKVTGLIDQDVKSHEFEFNDDLEREGSIAIQLYIDGNQINGMSHEIMVKKPPPPQLVYSQNGNIVTIDITAAGRGNKIKKLIINKGGSKLNKPKIIDDDQGQNYKQKVKLKGDNARITLKTTVISNYAANVKSEKTFFNK